MNKSLSYAAAAAFLVGASAMAPSPAAAMPAANVAEQMTPAVDSVRAVRVCNRWGRCWWTYAGGYGWGRPGWRGGYRYGWRHPYHWHRYGYGGWHRGWGGRRGWR